MTTEMIVNIIMFLDLILVIPMMYEVCFLS